LCRQIASPKIGVDYDTFHANIEEKDPVVALARIGPRWLVHVHISENGRGIPGTGHVSWGATMNTLKAMNYEGGSRSRASCPGSRRWPAQPASGGRSPEMVMSWPGAVFDFSGALWLDQAVGGRPGVLVRASCLNNITAATNPITTSRGSLKNAAPP